MEALQITLPDRRRFMTDKDNLPLLQEFAKTFDARMAVVRTTGEVELLRLADLAKAVCQQDRKPAPEAAKPTGREALLARANEIRTTIRGQLLARRPVSAARVAERFRGYGLSRSTISYHLTAVRKQLDDEGYTVRRVGGEYRLD